MFFSLEKLNQSLNENYPRGSARLRSAFTKVSSLKSSKTEYGHSRRHARLFASSYPESIGLLRSVWVVDQATSKYQDTSVVTKKKCSFHSLMEEGTSNRNFCLLLNKKYHQPPPRGCLFRQKHVRNRPRMGRRSSILHKHINPIM